MQKAISKLPGWLILSLALVGCGADPGTTVPTQNPYSASSSYDSSLYAAYPSNGSDTTGLPYDYTSDYATDGTYTGSDDSLPLTETATESATVKSGVAVELIDTATHGVWGWKRCEAQIRITNHEATAQQGFLFVSYTLKGREVELQYRSMDLAPGASKAFTMTSTVQADDATLEFRKKLL